MLDFTVCMVVGGLILSLGGWVYFKNPRGSINRIFFLLAVSASIWVLSNFLQNPSLTFSLTNLFLRIEFAAASITVYFFLLFCLSFHEVHLLSSPSRKVLVFLPAAVFALLPFSDLIITQIRFYESGIRFRMEPLFIVYVTYLRIYTGAGCLDLVLKYRKFRGIKKMQTLYLLSGFLLTLLVAVPLNLFLRTQFPLTISGAGNYGFLFFISFTTYAILKYRFMDIRVVIRQTTVYLACLLLILLLGLFLWFPVGSYFSLSPLINLTLILLCGVVVFQLVQSHIQKIASRYLFSSLQQTKEAVGFLTIGLFFLKWIISGLKSLLGGIKRVRLGDFSQRIEVKSQDELGFLSQSSNQMMEEIELRRSELEELNRTLENKVEERTKALTESEEKFRTIAESVHDMIFQLSPLGFIQYVSPKVKELYGYKPEDLVGKHLRKTTPVSEVPKALEALKTVLSGKAVRNFKINQLDSKGKIVPMEINITPVIKEGKIIAVQGVMRDITERKRAEEKLKASEEKYRSLFEAANDIIVMVDREGYISFANPKSFEVTGYSPEELKKFRFTDLLHPDDVPLIVERFKRRLAGEEVESSYEFRALTKDKVVLYMEAKVSSVKKEGRIIGIQAIVRDITERKYLEKSLERRINELKALYDTTRQVATSLKLDEVLSTITQESANLLNVDGAIIHLLDAERKILKVVKAHNLRTDSPALEVQSGGEGVLGQVLLKGEPIVIEDVQKDPRYLRKEWAKKEGFISFLGVPLESKKQALGTLSFLSRRKRLFREEEISLALAFANQAATAIEKSKLIANLKQAQIELQDRGRELEEKVKEKTEELRRSQAYLFQSEKLAGIGQLAAGIAHEIRNPLGIMATSLYYLNDVLPKKKEDVKRHFQILEAEINRCEAIINNLLEFSRKSDKELELIDVNSLLNVALSLIEKDLFVKDIKLTKKLEQNPTIRANVDEIKQVFLNLILNATQAMPHGGRLEIATSITENKRVRIKIADSGIGIPQKHLSQIFDPFFSTKAPGKGTGLGLSLVHGIIERSGGTIQVESQEDKGTTFIIEFPEIEDSFQGRD